MPFVPTLVSGATFYKYEPFSYTFTSGTAILTVSGTLVSYCTGSGTATVTFASTTGFLTTGSSTGETLTITPTGGTAITYTFFILAGRFIITPSIQGILLYQNEPISNTLSILGYSGTNVAFQAQTLLCNIYTVPTLPSSTLTLTGPVNTSSTSTFALGGIPTLLSASSNYYIVGSNSSNGYVATTLFSIQVTKERMWINSSAPMTNSGSAFTLTSPVVLTLNTAISSPPTFTVLTPISVSGSVTFTSNNFPPGISFTGGALVGTPTSSVATSYVSTITATAFGLSSLSATITLTFNYTPVILFSSSSFSVYSNVASSNQLSASVFPSTATITFSSANVPSGFTLTSAGLLTGKTTASTTTFAVTAASAGLTSVTSNVTINAVAVPITITTSLPSISGYVGQTPPTMTLTFSSAAYATGVNFITANGVTFTGLPPGFVSVWNYPQLTATIVGVVSSNAPSWTTPLIVTVNSIDGGSGSTTIPYSFLSDSCPITATTSTFAWSQNVAITPIQFSGTPVSGLPIVYYYGTSSIPPGLLVSPGGLLYGTPTTSTTQQTFTGLYGTTGNTFSTFPVSSGYTYTVASDTAQLASSPSTTAVTPGSFVSIPLTAQTASGVTPTGTMSLSAYSYGLTLTPSSISGTLGTCVYPGIVLPASFTIYGTFNPNSIPAVIGLSNTNPQIINRFILGSVAGGYSVYCDNGTMTTFTSIYTQVSQSPPHSCQIISNVTSSLTNWRGTLLITDGTPNAITSSILPTFASISSVTGGSSIVYSIYYTYLSFSSWIAYTASGNLLFATDPASQWTLRSPGPNNRSPNPSVDAGIAISGYVLQQFNGTLLLGGGANGGNALFYTSMSGIPNPYFVFSAATTASTFTNVYSMAASSTIVVAGGSVTSGLGLQYSTDGVTWSSVNTSGTPTVTTVTNVVYGGSGVDTWMALGPGGVAWSAGGNAWTYIPFTGLGATLGPLRFDGTYWCFFSTSSGVFTLYYHDALSSTMSTVSSWKTMTVSVPGASQIYTFPTPIYTSVESPQVTVYTGTTPLGPVFTPIPTTYSIYQYVPITPIVFSATQSPAYFLGSTLPPGMTWNGTTISGLSVQLGTFTVTVYAQSTSGSAAQTITFIVQRAPIMPRITSSAEYTSFIREKVTADAATSSINNHVTPFEVGPFLLERPPAVTTAPEICCEVTQTVKRIIN